jgi:hypothetical protein
MARKKHKETFSEMLASLKSTAVETKPVETIEERKYFLIVCEGTRTEPIYFDFLKQFLPKHLLETIRIIGQGDNTINVVKKAIEEKDKRSKDQINPNYDEVWAVFDKDNFPARRFNEAILLSKQHGINSGYTNQAFELWYVLHFQYLTTALNRGDYFNILTKILKKKYEKNNEDIVTLLFEKGNVKQAIEWAKDLEEMHKNSTPADSCPSTQVHILVENLLIYSRHPAIKNKLK